MLILFHCLLTWKIGNVFVWRRLILQLRIMQKMQEKPKENPFWKPKFVFCHVWIFIGFFMFLFEIYESGLFQIPLFQSIIVIYSEWNQTSFLRNHHQSIVLSSHMRLLFNLGLSKIINHECGYNVHFLYVCTSPPIYSQSTSTSLDIWFCKEGDTRFLALFSRDGLKWKSLILLD